MLGNMKPLPRLIIGVVLIGGFGWGINKMGWLEPAAQVVQETTQRVEAEKAADTSPSFIDRGMGFYKEWEATHHAKKKKEQEEQALRNAERVKQEENARAQAAAQAEEQRRLAEQKKLNETVEQVAQPVVSPLPPRPVQPTKITSPVTAAPAVNDCPSGNLALCALIKNQSR